LLRKNNKNLLLFCCWFVAYFFSRFAAVFCSLPRVEKPIRRALLFGAAELRVDPPTLASVARRIAVCQVDTGLASNIWNEPTHQRRGSNAGRCKAPSGTWAGIGKFPQRVSF
jgi:hypothetical protein